MEKILILNGFIERQEKIIMRLYKELSELDLDVYENRYVFALKVQQLYTALEDMMKNIARTFENQIDDLSSFHKELLIRMSTEIKDIRPAFLTEKSFALLDKIRAFRHFISHAYDCELDREELVLLQMKLTDSFSNLLDDLFRFKNFLNRIS